MSDLFELLPRITETQTSAHCAQLHFQKRRKKKPKVRRQEKKAKKKEALNEGGNRNHALMKPSQNLSVSASSPYADNVGLLRKKHQHRHPGFRDSTREFRNQDLHQCPSSVYSKCKTNS